MNGINYCHLRLLVLQYYLLASLSNFCLDNTGTNTDWWFIYKIPTNLGISDTSYAFYQPESGTNSIIFESGNDLDSIYSAPGRTLSPLYSFDSFTSAAAYNDQPPPGGHVNSNYGHLKGVLSYNYAIPSGFWLIHSVPKYPTFTNPSYTYTGSGKFGQSMLCISFNDSITFQNIAFQLRHMEPYIYTYSASQNEPVTSNFSTLGTRSWIYSTSILNNIFTPRNYQFYHFGKSGVQGVYLYEDIVAPYFQSSFAWETWRRRPYSSSICATYDSLNVKNVSAYAIKPDGSSIYISFKYTKDHSKMGISDMNQIICVGDINRMPSQTRRGGGTACIIDNNLWNALYSTFQYESCTYYVN